MKLILSMQAADGSVPNVDYVRTHDAKAPKDWPAGTDIHAESIYLRDMLYLVEPAVYKAFKAMLNNAQNVNGILLDAAQLKKASMLDAAILRRTTAEAAVPLWDGPAPHGCFFIMREVVSELLA